MKSDMSPVSSQYFEATSSSDYGSKGQKSSNQTTGLASDVATDRSRRLSQRSRNDKENIKMVRVPMKYKDLLHVFQSSGHYKDKSPILINMKESDINKIIEKQHNQKSVNSVLPQRSLRQSILLSPTSLKQPDKNDYFFERLSREPSEYKSQNELTSQSEYQPFDRGSKPPLGESQPQVYAMTDIQAYPMIGASGMKVDQRRRISPRKRSKRKKVKEKRSRNKTRSRTRKPKLGSRSMRSTSKSRGRSRHRRSPSTRNIISVRSSKSRPKRRPSQPRATSTVIVRTKKRRPVSCRSRRRGSPLNNIICCTPYPTCDHDCTPFTNPGRLQSPCRRSSRQLLHQNATRMPCNCTHCQEKLQFIQPGICSQKKNKWTNEYAIIPKPQVNLIDPCTEFDPSIYPRADRPCIRDGRGNPLTDCIGRPLRDPVGKRFLNFNANGSVMDTNFRGNFFTGQPPLCVKCPMPGVSCAPDTTHNWWMNCGYPVKANMAPFFNNVVAAENGCRRC